MKSLHVPTVRLWSFGTLLRSYGFVYTFEFAEMTANCVMLPESRDPGNRTMSIPNPTIVKIGPGFESLAMTCE